MKSLERNKILNEKIKSAKLSLAAETSKCARLMKQNNRLSKQANEHHTKIEIAKINAQSRFDVAQLNRNDAYRQGRQVSETAKFYGSTKKKVSQRSLIPRPNPSGQYSPSGKYSPSVSTPRNPGIEQVMLEELRAQRKENQKLLQILQSTTLERHRATSRKAPVDLVSDEDVESGASSSRQSEPQMFIQDDDDDDIFN